MAAPKRHGARSKQEEPADGDAVVAPYVPPAAPEGLSDGGRSLWSGIVDVHELDVTQLVTLEEACRAKDRLDEFARIIEGKGVLELMRFRVAEVFRNDDTPITVEVKFDDVITRANQTANLMKQLLAALRLPDGEGKRPQQRGGARGAYVSGGAGDGGDKARPGSSALGNLRGISGGRSA